MPRSPTPPEMRLLGALASEKSKNGLKLARRAWCLLDQNLSSKDLSSSGLSEDRILAIRSQFEDMGLVGLADAPRRGRPANLARIQRPDLPEVVRANGVGAVSVDRAQREQIWRSLRLRDSKVDPIRSWNIDMPMQSVRHQNQHELVGLWLSDGVIAASFRVKDVGGFTYGRWCRPPTAAKAAYLDSFKSAAQYANDLHRAIRMHLTYSTDAKTRAEAEKLEYWCDCVAKTASLNQCELYIFAEKPTLSLLALLKGLRKNKLWNGPGGLLKKLEFLEFMEWKSMNHGSFEAAIELVKPSKAAFSWVAIPRLLA